jgi:hypothetical protein
MVGLFRIAFRQIYGSSLILIECDPYLNIQPPSTLGPVKGKVL